MSLYNEKYLGAYSDAMDWIDFSHSSALTVNFRTYQLVRELMLGMKYGAPIQRALLKAQETIARCEKPTKED